MSEQQCQNMQYKNSARLSNETTTSATATCATTNSRTLN